MPKRIHLRTVTAEEEAAIRRLAASRKEPARLVQRAQVIVAMLDDPELTAVRRGCEPDTRAWGWGRCGSSVSTQRA